MNVLFVGAHPDDIETFAGGTATRYAEDGANVFFCVSTNGNIGSSTLSKEEIGAMRRKEAQNSADLIGAELIWLDIDDEFLFDTKENRLKFIDAFRVSDPDVVFCHWTDDYNPDHSWSGRIVDDSIHMAKIPLIKTEHPITSKDIPAVYYLDTIAGVNFVPELYVDIDDVFDKKIALLKQHKSQDSWMIDMFGCDMETFLDIPAKFRGLQAGYKRAEAFRPSYRWGRMPKQHLIPGYK